MASKSNSNNVTISLGFDGSSFIKGFDDASRELEDRVTLLKEKLQDPSVLSKFSDVGHGTDNVSSNADELYNQVTMLENVGRLGNIPSSMRERVHQTTNDMVGDVKKMLELISDPKSIDATGKFSETIEKQIKQGVGMLFAKSFMSTSSASIFENLMKKYGTSSGSTQKYMAGEYDALSRVVSQVTSNILATPSGSSLTDDALVHSIMKKSNVKAAAATFASNTKMKDDDVRKLITAAVRDNATFQRQSYADVAASHSSGSLDNVLIGRHNETLEDLIPRTSLEHLKAVDKTKPTMDKIKNGPQAAEYAQVISKDERDTLANTAKSNTLVKKALIDVGAAGVDTTGTFYLKKDIDRLTVARAMGKLHLEGRNALEGAPQYYRSVESVNPYDQERLGNKTNRISLEYVNAVNDLSNVNTGLDPVYLDRRSVKPAESGHRFADDPHYEAIGKTAISIKPEQYQIPSIAFSDYRKSTPTILDTKARGGSYEGPKEGESGWKMVSQSLFTDLLGMHGHNTFGNGSKEDPDHPAYMMVDVGSDIFGDEWRDDLQGASMRKKNEDTDKYLRENVFATDDKGNPIARDYGKYGQYVPFTVKDGKIIMVSKERYDAVAKRAADLGIEGNVFRNLIDPQRDYGKEGGETVWKKLEAVNRITTPGVPVSSLNGGHELMPRSNDGKFDAGGIAFIDTEDMFPEINGKKNVRGFANGAAFFMPDDLGGGYFPEPMQIRGYGIKGTGQTLDYKKMWKAASSDPHWYVPLAGRSKEIKKRYQEKGIQDFSPEELQENFVDLMTTSAVFDASTLKTPYMLEKTDQNGQAVPLTLKEMQERFAKLYTFTGGLYGAKTSDESQTSSNPYISSQVSQHFLMNPEMLEQWKTTWIGYLDRLNDPQEVVKMLFSNPDDPLARKVQNNTAELFSNSEARSRVQEAKNTANAMLAEGKMPIGKNARMGMALFNPFELVQSSMIKNGIAPTKSDADDLALADDEISFNPFSEDFLSLWRFPSTLGEQLTAKNVRNRFAKAAEKFGMDPNALYMNAQMLDLLGGGDFDGDLVQIVKGSVVKHVQETQKQREQQIAKMNKSGRVSDPKKISAEKRRTTTGQIIPDDYSQLAYMQAGASYAMAPVSNVNNVIGMIDSMNDDQMQTYGYGMLMAKKMYDIDSVFQKTGVIATWDNYAKEARNLGLPFMSRFKEINGAQQESDYAKYKDGSLYNLPSVYSARDLFMIEQLSQNHDAAAMFGKYFRDQELVQGLDESTKYGKARADYLKLRNKADRAVSESAVPYGSKTMSELSDRLITWDSVVRNEEITLDREIALNEIPSSEEAKKKDPRAEENRKEELEKLKRKKEEFNRQKSEIRKHQKQAEFNNALGFTEHNVYGANAKGYFAPGMSSFSGLMDPARGTTDDYLFDSAEDKHVQAAAVQAENQMELDSIIAAAKSDSVTMAAQMAADATLRKQGVQTPMSTANENVGLTPLAKKGLRKFDDLTFSHSMLSMFGYEGAFKGTNAYANPETWFKKYVLKNAKEPETLESRLGTAVHDVVRSYVGVLSGADTSNPLPDAETREKMFLEALVQPSGGKASPFGSDIQNIDDVIDNAKRSGRMPMRQKYTKALAFLREGLPKALDGMTFNAAEDEGSEIKIDGTNFEEALGRKADGTARKFSGSIDLLGKTKEGKSIAIDIKSNHSLEETMPQLGAYQIAHPTDRIGVLNYLEGADARIQTQDTTPQFKNTAIDSIRQTVAFMQQVAMQTGLDPTEFGKWLEGDVGPSNNDFDIVGTVANRTNRVRVDESNGRITGKTIALGMTSHEDILKDIELYQGIASKLKGKGFRYSGIQGTQNEWENTRNKITNGYEANLAMHRANGSLIDENGNKTAEAMQLERAHADAMSEFELSRGLASTGQIKDLESFLDKISGTGNINTVASSIAKQFETLTSSIQNARSALDSLEQDLVESERVSMDADGNITDVVAKHIDTLTPQLTALKKQRNDSKYKDYDALKEKTDAVLGKITTQVSDPSEDLTLKKENDLDDLINAQNDVANARSALRANGIEAFTEADRKALDDAIAERHKIADGKKKISQKDKARITALEDKVIYPLTQRKTDNASVFAAVDNYNLLLGASGLSDEDVTTYRDAIPIVKEASKIDENIAAKQDEIDAQKLIKAKTDKNLLTVLEAKKRYEATADKRKYAVDTLTQDAYNQTMASFNSVGRLAVFGGVAESPYDKVLQTESEFRKGVVSKRNLLIEIENGRNDPSSKYWTFANNLSDAELEEMRRSVEEDEARTNSPEEMAKLSRQNWETYSAQRQSRMQNLNLQKSQRSPFARSFKSIYQRNLMQNQQIYTAYKQQQDADKATLQSLQTQRAGLVDVDGNARSGNEQKVAVIDQRIAETNVGIQDTETQMNSLTGTSGKMSAAFDSVGSSFARLGTMLGRKIFQKAVAEAKKAILEINAMMTDIQTITMKSDSEMTDVRSTALNNAVKLKTSSSNVMSVTKSLYRQGLSDEDVQARLETIVKMAKVTGMEVETATKAITTSMENGLVSTAEEAADAFVALGDNAATSAEEIAKGYQKAAATAKVSGVSNSELSALLTFGISDTQLSGVQIGTSINTIMARMRAVTANNYVKDQNGEITGINDVEKALSLANVSLREQDSTFRSTFDVLKDIGMVWDELSDTQQSVLTSSIAGTRQTNAFQTLMQGISDDGGETLEKYIDLAENSTGITDDKYEISVRSISAAVDELTSSFDALVSSMTNDSLITGFLDFLSSALQGMTALDGTVNMLTIGLTTIAGFLVGGGPVGALLGLVGGIGLSSSIGSLSKLFSSKSDETIHQEKLQSQSEYIQRVSNNASNRFETADSAIENMTNIEKSFVNLDDAAKTAAIDSFKKSLTDLASVMPSVASSINIGATSFETLGEQLEIAKEKTEEERKSIVKTLRLASLSYANEKIQDYQQQYEEETSGTLTQEDIDAAKNAAENGFELINVTGAAGGSFKPSLESLESGSDAGYLGNSLFMSLMMGSLISDKGTSDPVLEEEFRQKFDDPDSAKGAVDAFSKLFEHGFNNGGFKITDDKENSIDIKDAYGSIDAFFNEFNGAGKDAILEKIGVSKEVAMKSILSYLDSVISGETDNTANALLFGGMDQAQQTTKALIDPITEDAFAEVAKGLSTDETMQQVYMNAYRRIYEGMITDENEKIDVDKIFDSSTLKAASDELIDSEGGLKKEAIAGEDYPYYVKGKDGTIIKGFSALDEANDFVKKNPVLTHNDVINRDTETSANKDARNASLEVIAQQDKTYSSDINTLKNLAYNSKSTEELKENISSAEGSDFHFQEMLNKNPQLAYAFSRLTSDEQKKDNPYGYTIDDFKRDVAAAMAGHVASNDDFEFIRSSLSGENGANFAESLQTDDAYAYDYERLKPMYGEDVVERYLEEVKNGESGDATAQFERAVASQEVLDRYASNIYVEDIKTAVSALKTGGTEAASYMATIMNAIIDRDNAIAAFRRVQNNEAKPEDYETIANYTGFNQNEIITGKISHDDIETNINTSDQAKATIYKGALESLTGDRSIISELANGEKTSDQIEDEAAKNLVKLLENRSVTFNPDGTIAFSENGKDNALTLADSITLGSASTKYNATGKKYKVLADKAANAKSYSDIVEDLGDEYIELYNNDDVAKAYLDYLSGNQNDTDAIAGLTSYFSRKATGKTGTFAENNDFVMSKVLGKGWQNLETVDWETAKTKYADMIANDPFLASLFEQALGETDSGTALQSILSGDTDINSDAFKAFIASFTGSLAEDKKDSRYASEIGNFESSMNGFTDEAMSTYANYAEQIRSSKQAMYNYSMAVNGEATSAQTGALATYLGLADDDLTEMLETAEGKKQLEKLLQEKTEGFTEVIATAIEDMLDVDLGGFSDGDDIKNILIEKASKKGKEILAMLLGLFDDITVNEGEISFYSGSDSGNKGLTEVIESKSNDYVEKVKAEHTAQNMLDLIEATSDREDRKTVADEYAQSYFPDKDWETGLTDEQAAITKSYLNGDINKDVASAYFQHEQSGSWTSETFKPFMDMILNQDGSLNTTQIQEWDKDETGSGSAILSVLESFPGFSETLTAIREGETDLTEHTKNLCDEYELLKITTEAYGDSASDIINIMEKLNGTESDIASVYSDFNRAAESASDFLYYYNKFNDGDRTAKTLTKLAEAVGMTKEAFENLPEETQKAFIETALSGSLDPINNALTATVSNVNSDGFSLSGAILNMFVGEDGEIEDGLEQFCSGIERNKDGAIEKINISFDQLQAALETKQITLPLENVASLATVVGSANLGTVTITLSDIASNGDNATATIIATVDPTEGEGFQQHGGGGGGGGKSAAQKLMDKQKHDKTLYDHQIKMAQYEQTKYQNVGQLSNYGKMIEAEIEIERDRLPVIQENIDALKAQMAETEQDSDDWYSLRDAILEAEEEYAEINNTIEENIEKLEENHQAILKLHTDLEDVVTSEIQNRIQKEKDMLAGSVDLQSTILEAIKQRYQDEWDLIKKDIDKKKEALEEEKSLIDERLQARKDAEDEEEKYRELSELRNQLSMISMDSTRTKDAAELREKIADLEKEIGWDIAEDEAKLQQDAIQDQLDAYDDYITNGDEDLEDMLSDANNFASEVNDVMRLNQEEMFQWMKENVSDYVNSLEDAQIQMVQGWKDTYSQMMGIEETYWEQVGHVLNSRQEFLEYMTQSDEYLNASADEQAQLLYQWQQQYDDWINALQTNAAYSHDDSGVGGSSYTLNVEGVTDYSDYYEQIIALLQSGAGTTSIPGAITTTPHYANGGLIDYTGLAWVDGTPETPESYLDAEDTALLRRMLDTANRVNVTPYVSNVDSKSFTSSGSVHIDNVAIELNEAQFHTDDDYQTIAAKVGEAFVKELSKQGFRTTSFSY